MDKKKLILVADDDPEMVKLLKLELESGDYDVISAGTGEETIRMIDRRHPDLVILDYHMPEGNGVYVMTRLRTALETFSIPVIMLTAYESRELRQQAFGLSASSFLSKPFKPGVLLKKAGEILKPADDKED